LPFKPFIKKIYNYIQILRLDSEITPTHLQVFIVLQNQLSILSLVPCFHKLRLESIKNIHDRIKAGIYLIDNHTNLKPNYKTHKLMFTVITGSNAANSR